MRFFGAKPPTAGEDAASGAGPAAGAPGAVAVADGDVAEDQVGFADAEPTVPNAVVPIGGLRLRRAAGPAGAGGPVPGGMAGVAQVDGEGVALEDEGSGPQVAGSALLAGAASMFSAARAEVDAGLAERRAARLAAQRSTWRTARVAAFSVVAGVVIVVIVALTTPVLATRHVRLAGVDAGVGRRLRTEAGLDGRLPMVWLVDTDAARAALHDDPWVRSVRFRRVFPWTLIVDVVLRRPVAVLDDGTHQAVVDDSARVIAPLAEVANDPRTQSLPRLAAATVPPPGHEWTDPAGREVVRIGAAMPPSLLALIERFGIVDGEVGATLRNGIVVRFGTADDAPAKAATLAAVLADLAAQNLTVRSIDVSSPVAPAYVALNPPKPTKPGTRPRG